MVFDTDTGNLNILKDNIERLKACNAVAEVLTIPQVHNLEDELIRSCNIKNITQLLNSKSVKDFKRDIVLVSNLDKKLQEKGFSIEKFWSANPQKPYDKQKNESEKIKILK